MRKKIDLNNSYNVKTFDEGFDEFITYCKARNLRPTTIKYYDDMVNIWYKFCDYKTQIRDIKEDKIKEFIIFLQTKMNENDVTINTVIRGMRVIFYYFMKLEYMENFKISLPKMNKQVIETYTDTEIKILLEKPNLKKCNFIQYRSWCICNFLLGTGCRARTLVNIKIVDLDFENNLITYTYTKNRKQQIVPMSNSLKLILIEYLQYRKGKKDDYLFVNAYGDLLTVDQLGRNIKDYNRKRGVAKVCLQRCTPVFATPRFLL